VDHLFPGNELYHKANAVHLDAAGNMIVADQLFENVTHLLAQ